MCGSDSSLTGFSLLVFHLPFGKRAAFNGLRLAFRSGRNRRAVRCGAEFPSSWRRPSGASLPGCPSHLFAGRPAPPTGGVTRRGATAGTDHPAVRGLLVGRKFGRRSCKEYSTEGGRDFTQLSLPESPEWLDQDRPSGWIGQDLSDIKGFPVPQRPFTHGLTAS